MSLPYIILIVAGVIILGFALIIIIGKISSSSKKVVNSGLAKKVNKLNKEVSHDKKPPQEKPKDEFDLKPPKHEEVIIPTKKGEVLTQDLDENDIELLGAVKEEQPPKPEEPKRKSFEEIMRSRQANRANQKQTAPPQADDDFEEFRSKHSSYTSYVKDDALIDEIKTLSPEMKAVVFSNLFNRINHE